ncbi:unnamed protein product [Urochloa humidicola]
MASSTPRAAAIAGVLVAVVVAALCGVHGATAQLCEDYYADTCPDAYDIVKQVLIQAHQSDERIYASLIRLHFHDCFVQSGGPSWGVLLGRLDGKTSDFTGSGNLSAPFEDLATLQGKFRAVGLNDDVDLVALSGAHTFGRVQCANVAAPPADRLYNFSGTNMPDPTMDSAYRAFLSQRCPRNGDGRVLNDLDPTTPDTFDNHYYTNIEVNRGFLTSDQELKSSPQAQGTTAPIVDQFASSQDAFFASFAQSMINMGNIRPVTDPSLGEVRTNCRRVN